MQIGCHTVMGQWHLGVHANGFLNLRLNPPPPLPECAPNLAPPTPRYQRKDSMSRYEITSAFRCQSTAGESQSGHCVSMNN